jgi:hypothetical protein
MLWLIQTTLCACAQIMAIPTTITYTNGVLTGSGFDEWFGSYSHSSYLVWHEATYHWAVLSCTESPVTFGTKNHVS